MLGPALALRTTLTKPTQITDRLQKNVLNRHAWAARDQPRIAIVTWTERTYHRGPIDPHRIRDHHDHDSR